jgi:NADH-ubiquinone oxidoreductase chain 2
MLLIGIITILLYSSYNEIYKTELKRIYQISGIIILYTIIILYNSINIIYIGKSLILFNDIINITSYTIYIKILILILTIIYILINNEYINITINNNIGDKLNKNISYNSNFIILLLFNILGILLLIESYNLILIYIAIELQSYSIYIITSKYISSIKDHSYNTSK